MSEKTEKQEQAEFLRWFRDTFPQHKIAAIPNGSQRSKKTAIQLKNEGMSPGFPDLEIPFLSLYIEMKAQKRGVVSKEQKEWIEYLRSISKRAEVAKGAEEAKRITLNAYDDYLALHGGGDDSRTQEK